MEVKINAEPVDPKEDAKYGDYDEWEIDSAVNTLIEAEQIKADKDKMKYVYPILQEKLNKTKTAIDSLAKLKDVIKEKANATDQTKG